MVEGADIDHIAAVFEAARMTLDDDRLSIRSMIWAKDAAALDESAFIEALERMSKIGLDEFVQDGEEMVGGE